MTGAPAEDQAARFRADLAGLTPIDAGQRIGIAVSGGHDSLALLLLAHAAFPGRAAAATVDHGLRPEAAEEAAEVSRICAALGIPHATLRCEVRHEGDGWQAAARRMRYAELVRWCRAEDIPLLLTAHHADDQAETLLMRLARGSGVAGLAGIRAVRPATDDAALLLVRPLLGWRKAELAAIAADAGLIACDDPSNHDDRFDRTAARALIAANPWLDPLRLAASAHHLAESETALNWAAAHYADRIIFDGAVATLDPTGLPPEIVRRLTLRIFSLFGQNPRGPEITRLADRLRAGAIVTLAGVKAISDAPWRFEAAPPRRNS